MRRRGSLHSLRLIAGALAGLSMGALASPCVARAAGDAGGAQVVGTVDGQPIHLADVQVHVRPAEPQVGTAPPSDPRQLAWNAAVRVLLLAREARRRGIDGGSGAPALVEARLVQRVVHDEVARRTASAPKIDDAAARRYFEEHRTLLSSVTSARVATIVVADRVAAQALLPRVAAADDGAFAQLVAEHSLDSASRGGHLAEIDRHGHGLQPALARVAIQLKTSGAVGLAEGEDGRYYVLRATDVQLESKPWTPALAARVRELIAHGEREAATDALVAGLRAAAVIKLDEEVLARLTVPRWDEFPAATKP